MPALTDCCASFRHFGRAKMTYDTVKHQFKTLFYVEMDIFRNGHFLAQTWFVLIKLMWLWLKLSNKESEWKHKWQFSTWICDETWQAPFYIYIYLIFNLQSSLRLLSIVHIVSGGGSGDNTIPIGCQAASEHQLQDFSCQRNTLRSPAVFWRVNHCP